MNYKLYFLTTLLLLPSCAVTPKLTAIENNNLTVFNKRFERKNLNIKEFIIPQQTKALFPKSNTNTVPNKLLLQEIVAYVAMLPNKKETLDFWNYPTETITHGGDCEDKAHLLASLLIFHGFKNVYAVKGEFSRNFLKPKEGHIWIELTLNNETYLIDTLNKKNKIQKKIKSSGYFPFFKYNNNNAFQFKIAD